MDDGCENGGKDAVVAFLSLRVLVTTTRWWEPLSLPTIALFIVADLWLWWWLRARLFAHRRQQTRTSSRRADLSLSSSSPESEGEGVRGGLSTPLAPSFLAFKGVVIIRFDWNSLFEEWCICHHYILPFSPPLSPLILRFIPYTRTVLGWLFSE